jgi:hypothetical protein
MSLGKQNSVLVHSLLCGRHELRVQARRWLISTSHGGEAAARLFHDAYAGRWITDKKKRFVLRTWYWRLTEKK